MPVLTAPVDYMPWTPKEALGEIKERDDSLESKVREIREKIDRIRSEDLSDVRTIKDYLNSMREDLKTLKELTGDLETRVKAVEELLGVGTSVGLWKASTCSYRLNDGICMAWKLDEASANKIRSIFGNSSVRENNGVLRVVVDKVPLLCAFCPLYKPKEKQALRKV